MTRRRQLLLTIMQQTLQIPNALRPRSQLPLRNRSFLLQLAVLLHELPLHYGELFQIAFEECHFLLLGAVIRCAEHIVVLFACFVEGDFEFDDLLWGVLR